MAGDGDNIFVRLSEKPQVIRVLAKKPEAGALERRNNELRDRQNRNSGLDA